MKYYRFPPEKENQCEIRLFASERIYNNLEKPALQQLFNARQLPGIIAVVGLPDIHKGYGLPIGGIMVSELEKGIISPGAVGFDINCGVRLLTSNVSLSRVKNKTQQLLAAIKKGIPAGVGKTSQLNFSKKEFKNIVEKGLPYTVKTLKAGTENDICSCEEQGFIGQAKLNKVSQKASKRGLSQLGTLGSGNHFVEIQEIDQIYDKAFFEKTIGSCDQYKNRAFIMLHTGSRGFGHQIATDYTKLAKKNNSQYSFQLPVKNLASFPISFREGQDYLQAMACAANFAFANRQFITQKLRKIFRNFFPKAELKLFYDLTHNIAKKEKHAIADCANSDSKEHREVLVHRKGATRLKKNGIALIPGSMGTGSYIVRSLNSEANRLSFESVAHGAGRTMGRREADRSISDSQYRKSLKGVSVISGSNSSLFDESPLAYKDIDTIIDSLQKTELAKPIVRLRPLAVLKG